MGRILQAIKPLLRHYLIAELRIQLRTGKHLTFTGQQGFFLSRKRSGLRGLFQNRKAGLLTPQLLTLLADGVIDALMLLQVRSCVCSSSVWALAVSVARAPAGF